MDMNTPRQLKCVACPLSWTPPALWMHTESGCKQYWASLNWLLVHCCQSCLPSKRSLKDPLSILLSSLWNSYVLSSENWDTWCCSWDRPRSRGPKSSGCNRSWTKFSLRCAQPWRRSAGLLRWSRCIWGKLLLWSFSLPPRTLGCRTSILFLSNRLYNNWQQAGGGDQECSR